MNGVHDMGGMHGFGPIEIEKDEPLFHAKWEGRVRAITMLTPFNLDELRMGIEQMAPADYLSSSYYERWLTSTAYGWMLHGFITEEELEARCAYYEEHPTAPMPIWPGPNPEKPRAEKYMTTEERDIVPAFAVGDVVVVTNVHPQGHTRRPRYIRGKCGIVNRIHVPEIFPDTNAHGLGPNPQTVYSVTFEAQELWGASAEPNHKVSIDLWESYLERDGETERTGEL